jgi:penicillin-binding protein 1A
MGLLRAFRRLGFFPKLLVFLLLLGLLAVAGTAGYFYWLSLPYNLAEVEKMPERAVIMDRDGRPYNRIYGENRTVVPQDQVSKNFISALLAREDTRFYWHPGIDPKGIVRAAVRNAQDGEASEGGSTLTQQLARNTFTLGGKTLHRKGLEAMVAFRIEHRYTKQQILEHYMNRIYFGSGLYGIESASLGYFGKPSKDLTLSEAALLAGIIRGPNQFSPMYKLDAALKERDGVLSRMRVLKMISEEEYKKALADTPRIAPAPELLPEQNYAMDYIRRDMRLMTDAKDRQQGGMKIHTTIDAHLQKEAERILDEHLSKLEKQKGWRHPRREGFQGDPDDPSSQTPYVQGAVVVVENATGAIRAIVGGRSYQESKFNRALMARRQVGSSFKPFIYAAAFQHGLLPHSPLSDDRIQPGEVRGLSKPWSPDNSDGTYTGWQTADFGLYKSRNTMSVRAGELAGLENVLALAERAGISRDVKILRFPSSYLGSFESTLRDMTLAYTVFPNRGFRPKEHIIDFVEDQDGQTIYKRTDSTIPVTEPYGAWLAHLVMKRTFTKGTAATAADLGFNAPAGGKTGTTNDYHDAWFIGYTSSLTCGVWVGMDQPQPIMGKGYGSTLALPIWVDIMKDADPLKYPTNDFMNGEPEKLLPLCGASGLLANTACEADGTLKQYVFPQTMDGPREVCPYSSHPGYGRAAALANADAPPRDERRARRARPVDSIVGGIRRLFGF